MMILRSTPASPFGRKVNIGASLLGLSGEIRIEPADLADAADSVRRQNPLGKIPTLVLEDGSTLFDSRVILEYLDHRAGGGRIVPREPAARFGALRLQALADGMTDAQILLIYEGRWRPPEKHEQKWLDYQADKIKRGLAALEASPPGLDPIPNVGQIALACFLGHRDLRFPGSWREGHRKLAGWLDRFAAQVPAFAATKV
jgi:glutathione S-transferase